MASAAASVAATPEDTESRWVIIQTTTTSDNRDMVHSVYVVKTSAEVEELKAEAEDSRDFMSIDAREFSAKKDMRVLHVVFHYHDNYADVVGTFETHEEANAFYKSEVAEMLDGVSDLYEGECIKLAKYPDGGSMATLYDAHGNYPDKGDRWVFTTLSFP
jgi:hypothetical protein